MNNQFRNIIQSSQANISSSDVTPIFVFSLPRSGSTLLQRILASHDEIASTAEPWILLPLLYARKERGIYTEYRQGSAARAIQDFCAELPAKETDYQNALRDFVTRLYMKAASQAKYFVDKTPRYHLVINEIIELFPDAKFIFLWRNPLAVVASIVESFTHGAWKLYRYQVDLYEGLPNLVQAYRAHTDHSYAVSYEDLLTDPESSCRSLFSYLGLPFDTSLLSNFMKTRFHGRMGDQIGVRQYDGLSKEPLDKWRQTFNNPLRRAWCRHYLERIGRERLDTMGYDPDLLLQQLRSSPISMRYVIADLCYTGFGIVYRTTEPRIVKHKLERFRDRVRIYAHT